MWAYVDVPAKPDARRPDAAPPGPAPAETAR